MSDACFNRSHLEATTGIRLEACMDNHHLEAPDFMDRAFFIFFIAQLLPLIVALGLHRYNSASFTALQPPTRRPLVSLGQRLGRRGPRGP